MAGSEQKWPTVWLAREKGSVFDSPAVWLVNACRNPRFEATRYIPITALQDPEVVEALAKAIYEQARHGSAAKNSTWAAVSAEAKGYYRETARDCHLQAITEALGKEGS